MAKVFNEGDKALVVADNISHGFDLGTVVTVTRVDENGDPEYARDENGIGAWVCKEDLKPIEKPATCEFKVGDKVVVVGKTLWHGFDEGEVVTVVDVIKENYCCEDKKGLQQLLVAKDLKRYNGEITINFTVPKEDLKKAVNILGKAFDGYMTYEGLYNALNGTKK